MSSLHKGTAASADRTARINRWLIVTLLAMVAFFATYRYAEARSTTAAPAAPNATASAGSALGAASPAVVSGGGGCCGGGGGGPKVSKQADLAGGVQKISVDLSSGSYDPNELQLKAGVPARITFGQGSGCLGQVQSQDLGFYEDLTGGPKTVSIPPLKAGTYTFTCGMGMVAGSIVVE